MKEKINYIVVIILSTFVGAGIMYGIMKTIPSTASSVINLSENKVTVTDKGISDGVDKVKESVVVVMALNEGKVVSSGTGFAYKKDKQYTYIMTNHHVISGSKEIKLQLYSGKEIEATVVGSDIYTDIAILKTSINNIEKLVELGKSEDARVGDTVFTIGTPVDTIYAGTVTRGILSGKNRMVSVNTSNGYSNDWIMNVMQTDASINPGNSGGPLCNVNGEVIGINSLKLVESSIEGIGFAIPIEDALEYAQIAISGEKIVRPLLGIEMVNSSERYKLAIEGIEISDNITNGIVVVNVVKNSPADKAKLQRGDVITSIAGNNVKTVAELRYYLYKHKPNEKIEVTYIRNEKSNKVNVTLVANEE